MTEELPFCECGCGKRVTKIGNRFLRGHFNRGKKFPAEWRKNMSKPKSPSHCLAISKGAKNRYRDPEERKKLSELAKNKPKSLDHGKAISEGKLREKEPLPDDWRIDRNSKTVMNKNSSQYLGVFIAEKLTSKMFKNVQRMPQGNHGFDLICNEGYKIDVKSSATGSKGYWQFGIKKNKMADYFVIIAFESRDDLTPIHLWLIPGKDINHLNIIHISKVTLSRWSKYEQPIDKAILCCNEMKGESV